jgi:hypothetical protein
VLNEGGRPFYGRACKEGTKQQQLQQHCCWLLLALLPATGNDKLWFEHGAVWISVSEG